MGQVRTRPRIGNTMRQSIHIASYPKGSSDIKSEVLPVTDNVALQGNKVDFHLAMKGDEAKALFDDMAEELGKSYCQDKIKVGQFGAMMSVSIENDGPVTIELESKPEAKKVEVVKS